MYGPGKATPAGQLLNFEVREISTYSVPTWRALPFTRNDLQRRFPPWPWHLRTVRFFAGSVRFATATELFTLPPYGTFRFQTSLPVSAFTANTQPRVLATYMQPSAITGVAVKSPSAPTALVENVKAGDSVGTSAALMTASS